MLHIAARVFTPTGAAADVFGFSFSLLEVFGFAADEPLSPLAPLAALPTAAAGDFLGDAFDAAGAGDDMSCCGFATLADDSMS